MKYALNFFFAAAVALPLACAAAAGPSGAPTGTIVANKEVMDEAVAALTMLGFSPAPSQKAVLGILRAEPEATVERVIKLALKML